MHPVSSEEHRQQMLDMLPDQFVLTLAHDMRGRISMIMGSIEMLKDNVNDPAAALTPEESHKLLEIIEKSGADLLSLTAILQDYQKFPASPILENVSPRKNGKAKA